MRSRYVFWVGIFGLIIIALLSGCQFVQRMLSDRKVDLPEITLDRIEVKKDKQYLGWWFYADNIDPTIGSKGNHGAPMALAFIFKIKNLNRVPVLLNEINFTVKFEEYKMDIIQSKEKMWIPPGETNQLRVYSLFNVQSARLNLLVQGGQNLLTDKEQKPKITDQKKEDGKEKERENWLWTRLQEYWTEIQKQETIIPNQETFVSVADVCANMEAKGSTFNVPEPDKDCPKSSNQNN